MEALNELALFAGAGGGLLGGRLLGWRTVCYVEKEEYPVEVLKARIRDGYLDDAPIWDDCFTFDGKPWRGAVDIITAGFPCQPFSVAGRGLAENDPRNGWPALLRIIGEVEPRFLFLENVPALLAKGYFGQILGELSESGYCVRWDVVSAQAIGARHKRERLWIVAHANNFDEPLPKQSREDSVYVGRDGAVEYVAGQDVSYPAVERQSGQGQPDERCGAETVGEGETDFIIAERERGIWRIEPELGRVANGVPHRVDRLRAIGNGQVPAVAKVAWQMLTSDWRL